MRFTLSLCCFVILLSGCDIDQAGPKSSNGFFQTVIEIPAGTNKKMELDKGSGEIRQDIKDGLPRVIDYMPYPGNYGYVPGTKMTSDNGGDGDALDVLIICESLPIGTVLEFEPIAMIKLIDEGEIDNKIVGVPVDPEYRLFEASTFYDFQLACKQCPKIIQLWFENYSDDKVLFQGWEDESIAISEIERWTVE